MVTIKPSKKTQKKSHSLWESFKRLKLLSRANYTAAFLSGIIIFVLVFYNTYATVLRHFFNAPPLGSMEISTLLLPVLVFLGLAHTYEKNGHILVDVLIIRLQERKRRSFKLVGNIIIAICSVILVWKGSAAALDKLYERSSSELMIRLFPFYIFIPLGSLLLLIQSLKNIFKDIRSLMARDSNHDEL